MKRGIAAAAIVLGLLADSSAAAPQARVGGGGTQAPSGMRAPQTPPTSPAPSNPTPPPRVTGSARFIDGRQLVFPFWAFNGPCLWCFPLWSQSVTFVPVQSLALEGAPTGGVQLDVDPRSAEVYVDGTRVGVINEFSGYYKHLKLGAGAHLVTILAPDYEPLTIPMLVSPGHTMTYRGTLTRAYGR